MPKLVPAMDSKAPEQPDLPFEQALEKLESIVESMETDDLPLERLLTSFEQGMQLVAVCQNKLAEAEVKIQQLERNAAGETILKQVSVPLENSEA